MPVNSKRKELKNILPQWTLIKDCLSGEAVIKKKKEVYLPKPNADDLSIENDNRYKSYLERAVFYNVTARTLKGLTGQVFLKDPVMEIPDDLKMLEKDSDGKGVTLVQSSQKAVTDTFSYGRSGVLVDYPYTGNGSSRSDIQKGIARPLIKVFSPFDIINWRTFKEGARTKLALLVLKETVNEISSEDKFISEEVNYYRVFELVNKKVVVTIYKEKVRDDIKLNQQGIFITDSNGKSLEEIPFMFIGSDNNDEVIDDSPLYDMASLNIAHYRNSADYEESCFIAGQPTFFITGLTKQWIDEVYKDKPIQVGSRAAILGPLNSKMGLIQAQENSMPKEAMDSKERQMVALGAKLVEQRQVQRTATEANLETTSEGSVLTTIAKNVSSVFVWALETCTKFTGSSPEGIKFELNTDFEISNMTAEDRQQIILEMQAGLISWTEARSTLRKTPYVSQEDEVAKTEIDAYMKKKAELAKKDRPKAGINQNISGDE